VFKNGLVVLNNFDSTMYKPKSKKTVKFRNKSNNKEVKVGQELSELKPAESLSDILNSKELFVLNSMTQETTTTSHGL
jgi:hypothetical protein